jgi:cyclophilin family peptidyl-prolyl cis-trans isomerase
MSLRLFLSTIVLASVLLGGCSTAPSTTGIGPASAVMLITPGSTTKWESYGGLIKFSKDKKPLRVVIELRDDAAPQTVENFKELVSRRYYDGMSFHRLFPHLMVQTGDPKSRYGESDRSGTGGPGYTIPAEISLKLDAGAVVASRLPDGLNPTRASNGSQFFICLQPMPQLDGQYTVFGKVTDGLDQLDAISALPVNSNDFPIEKVVIKSIRMQ